MADRGSRDRIQHDLLRSELTLLQEMFPALRADLLVEILRCNEWDVAVSADAALAWGVVHEDDTSERQTWTTSPGTSPGRARPLSGLVSFSGDAADSIPIFRERAGLNRAAPVAAVPDATVRSRNQHQPRSYLLSLIHI